MDHSKDGRRYLSGRAGGPKANCCWNSPCPHDENQRQAEETFLVNYGPWSLDDYQWLLLNGAAFL